MGVFTDSIQKYAPILEKVLGGVNDLVVKNRMSDAEASLQKMRDAKVNYDRFQKINRRIRGTVIPPNELYKPTTEYDFSTTNDLLNSTNAAKEYQKTLQPTVITNEDGTTTEQMPQVGENEFRQWLSQNPQHMTELTDLKYVKPKFQKMGDEEQQGLVYKKAGLTPEEVQFYNDWKKQNFDVTDHNTKLQSMVLDYVPGLTSRGAEGDRLAKLFQQKAGMLGIDDGKNIKYSYLNLKDGKMLRSGDDGSYEIVDYGDGDPQKKKKLKDLSATEMDKLSFESLISGYAPNELFASLYDFSPEIRAKLIEKYPEWKPEEDVLKGSSRTGSRRYGSKRKTEKDPLDDFLSVMSEIGLKNTGKKFEEWDKRPKGEPEGKDREKYTAAMNSVKELTGKSEAEIWDMVGEYESKTYKQDGKEKKSPYGNAINEDERYTINEVYYGTKFGKFNGQSLSDWVRSLRQTEDRDTFYKWADEVRNTADQYINDLGLTKNMAAEILTDVENQIQIIKSEHQGW